MNTAGQRKARRIRVAVWALLVGFVGGSTSAAVENPVSTSGAVSGQTVSLEFTDVPDAFLNTSLAVVERATPFEKEPALKSKTPVRATLQCGPADSDRVAFLWDRGASRFYVDLNRNLDLTDDAEGVFSGEGFSETAYAAPNDVRLPLAFPTGTRSAAVRLTLYGRPRGLFALAGLRSLWLGKVMLNQQEWQVGIIDDSLERGGGRHLLLRPWEQRNKAFQLNDGAAAVFGFTSTLFLNGRSYGLVAAETGTGDRAGIALTFTEQSPALGELRLTGQFIDRLGLESASGLVLLDRPDPQVKVPVGRYTATQVLLRAGEVGAVRNSRYGNNGVTVSEDAAVTLAVGGPLTNSVAVNRRGRTLVFSYQLVGAGNEVYNLTRAGPRQPPEFAVFEGDRKIASGKFEFG
jgi:hypothetical protein